MELLLRIIVPNICTEYFSGIFQEKTFKTIAIAIGQHMNSLVCLH